MNESANVIGTSAALTASRGKLLLAVVTLYCVLVSLIFRDTLMAMVDVWMRSESYAHGFLILPICLFLVWRMRGRFNDLTVRPEPRALLLVAGAGLAWLLGNIVDVQIVQRLAYVAILVSGIWVIAGNAVVRCYAFPLGFLFLAVPMGSELILPMMILTADTTEYMLRVSGVPVFREGLYLYLPTGTWSVIEECSGVRYVIASVTLGLCYAHLNYTSRWRQAAFVLAAAIVPVLANSARAYLVVMIGHLSDMRYGVGLDHLVLGWVMFAVVILLMFWIGSYWQQDTEPAVSSTPARTARELPVVSLAVVTGLAFLFASIWPAASLAMSRGNDFIEGAALTVPIAAENWQTMDEVSWRWRPPQPGADRKLDQVYALDMNPGTDPNTGTDSTGTNPAMVGLHLRQYLQQEQGAELVELFNPWRPSFSEWELMDQQKVLVELNEAAKVDEAWVVSAPDNLLIWSWYRLDGHNTANAYLVKMLEAKQQLIEGRRQGTRVFIATPMGGDRARARQVLQDFVTDHYNAIESSLDGGIIEPGANGDTKSSKAKSSKARTSKGNAP